jgi:hypothetical protein
MVAVNGRVDLHGNLELAWFDALFSRCLTKKRQLDRLPACNQTWRT